MVGLESFFSLENSKNLFRQATTPKSCGGKADFKYLALLGDFLLNLGLFEVFRKKNIKNSSDLTKKIQRIHNKLVLAKLGAFLNINNYMEPTDYNHKITTRELAESVEALIGANYRANGIKKNTDLIQKLFDIILNNNEFEKFEFDLKYINNISSPNQSMAQNIICFSKDSIQGGYFKKRKISISVNKGEKLVDWAQRKAKQNSLSMLILLSARLQDVSGSVWHLSIQNGELIFLNITLKDKKFFEIGYGKSVNQAQKQAGNRFIRNSNLFQWIEKYYGELRI